MFKLTDNISQCVSRLDNLTARQLPFATARALNDTAEDIRKAEVREMRAVFYRPTPYTLGAFQIRPATKDVAMAVVERKAVLGRKHYLEVEERGGPRPRTGLEMLLDQRVAYAGVLQAITPARGARLDQYGNWSSGQRNQVLSGLGAQRDARSNTTAASRKRNPSRSKYFVPRGGNDGGLPPGVYERNSRGVLFKILNFTAKVPLYAPRFDFEPVAMKEGMARMPVHFVRRMAEAMATAR